MLRGTSSAIPAVADPRRAALISQITGDTAMASGITAILNIANDPTKSGPATQLQAQQASQAVTIAAQDFQASVNAHAAKMAAYAGQKAALQTQLAVLKSNAQQ